IFSTPPCSPSFFKYTRGRFIYYFHHRFEMAFRVAAGRDRTRWMTFNLRRAADPNQALADDIEDRAIGFHPASGRPYHDDVVHEFAHAIDHADDGRLGENIETVLHEAWEALRRHGMVTEPYAEWLRGLPEAAFDSTTKETLDPRETVAVGFIDAEINGIVVGTPQWVVHHYVTTLRPPDIAADDRPREPTVSIGGRPSDDDDASRARHTGRLESRPSPEGSGSVGARPWDGLIASGWHPADGDRTKSAAQARIPDFGWLASVLGPLARYFDPSGDIPVLADRTADALATELLPLWHHLGALGAEFENRGFGKWYERTMLALTDRIVSAPVLRYRNLYKAEPGEIDDRYFPVGGRGEVDLAGKLLSVFKTAPGTPAGGVMFGDMWRELGDIVHGISAYWARERFQLTDNLDTFNAGVRAGLSPEDAARDTFTGKMADRRGYTEVVFDVLEGEPGNHDRVEVTFVRPSRLREMRCRTLAHQVGVRFPELLNRDGWSAEIARLRDQAARDLRQKRRMATRDGRDAEGWSSAVASTEARVARIEELAGETTRWWAEQDAGDHTAVATVAKELIQQNPGAVRVTFDTVLMPGHTVAVIAAQGRHDDALTDMLLRNLGLRTELRSGGYGVLRLNPVVGKDARGNTRVWAEDLGTTRIERPSGLVGSRPSESPADSPQISRWEMSAAEQSLRDRGEGVEERIRVGVNESFVVNFGAEEVGVYRPSSGEYHGLVEDGFEQVVLVPASGLAARIVATSRLDEKMAEIAAKIDPELGAGQVPTSTLWAGSRGPGALIMGAPDLETTPRFAELDPVRRDLAIVRGYILAECDPEDGTYLTTGSGNTVLTAKSGLCLPDGPYAFSTAERELPDGSFMRYPESPPEFLGHAVERADPRLHPIALAVAETLRPAWLADMLNTLGIERSAIDGALARLREIAENGRVVGDAWPYSPESTDDFEMPPEYSARGASIDGDRRQAERMAPTRDSYDLVPLDTDARAVEHIPRSSAKSFLLEVVDGRFIGPDGKPYTSPFLEKIGIRDVASLVMGPNIGDDYRAGPTHLDLYDEFPRSELGVPGYAVCSFIAGEPWGIEPFANAFGHFVDERNGGRRTFDPRKTMRAAAQLRYDLRTRGVVLSGNRFRDEIRGTLWRSATTAVTVGELIDRGAEAARELLPGFGMDDFWVVIERLESEPDRLSATLSLNPVRFEPGEVDLEWRRVDGELTARITRVDLGENPVRVAEVVHELDATLRPWLATSDVPLAGGAGHPAELTVREPLSAGRSQTAEQVGAWAATHLRTAGWQNASIDAVAAGLSELATDPLARDHVRVELQTFGEPGNRILLARTIETDVERPETTPRSDAPEIPHALAGMPHRFGVSELARGRSVWFVVEENAAPNTLAAAGTREENDRPTPWSNRRTDADARPAPSSSREADPEPGSRPKATPWSSAASSEALGRQRVPHPHAFDTAPEWLAAVRDGLALSPEQMETIIGATAGTWSDIELGARQLATDELRALMRQVPSVRGLYEPLAQHFFRELASVPGPGVGASLRFFREEAGLTPIRFAHRLGVLEVTVTKRELAGLLPPATAGWEAHVRALAAGTGPIDDTADIGACLETLRKRVGLPQRHLAEQLGFARDVVGDIEAGRRPPDRAEVEAYLRALVPGRPRYPEGYSRTCEYLRFLREDAGVQLREAARRAGMSPAMIINRESGRTNLTPEFVELCLREYGQGAVTFDQIVELSDRPETLGHRGTETPPLA
uniref:helix-turn-helix transcriptional regulator n=1 Tax=Nocardia wallacei TaxID=480035 RepID=UPI002453B27D